MNILFVHNNFPAQFKHIAAALQTFPEMKLAAIGSSTSTKLGSVDLLKYRVADADLAATHPFARRFDLECRRAEQVLYAASALGSKGFSPNTVLAHCGWGEGLVLREAFPDARIITYCEFFYRSENLDVNFDNEFPSLGVDGRVALQLKNASTLVSLVECDHGLSPTLWQKSTFPVDLQNKISVIHEGVDTDIIKPDPAATFKLPNGHRVSRKDEIVTFVARNLEPLRGYHVFTRAIPEILKARPKAQIVIVGDDRGAYGVSPPKGSTWRSIYFDQIKSRIDTSRVHFLGRLAYKDYLSVLRVSSAHVYLTYPFVLSWSMLEAMSAGCCVIGSDTGPVQEVINGQNGILVPFFDHEAVAARVIDVLSRPSRYDGMRQNARATVVENYALQKCLPKLIDFVCK